MQTFSPGNVSGCSGRFAFRICRIRYDFQSFYSRSRASAHSNRYDREQCQLSRACNLSALGNMQSVRWNVWKWPVSHAERSRVVHIPSKVSPKGDVPQLLGLGDLTRQYACYQQRTVWDDLDRITFHFAFSRNCGDQSIPVRVFAVSPAGNQYAIFSGFVAPIRSLLVACMFQNVATNMNSP